MHLQSIPIYLASFAFVLGVLVFVHEFGHYAVAKLFKVRVDVFSLGFGKRLLGFRRGDTDYRLSLLPLGGYVKMAGENPMEARTGDPGEFMSHPRWQRFLIAIAGPAMNIILAIAVLTGVYMVHYERSKPAEIGWVIAGSPEDFVLRSIPQLSGWSFAFACSAATIQAAAGNEESQTEERLGAKW